MKTFMDLAGAGLVLCALACHERASTPGSTAGLPANLGLAARAVIGAEDLWLVRVLESEQGGRDGNGDGDALDELVVVLDLARAARIQPALAVASAGSGPPPLLACDGAVAAFAVDEAAQARDLNDDGDENDRVPFVYDPRNGSLRNLAVAVNALAAGGALVAFAVDEAGQGGRDLDADGDGTGGVLSVYDLRDGSLTDLTLRDSAPLLVHDDYVALYLAEREGLDLSLDGDDDDELVFEVYDGRVRLLHNTTLVLAPRAVVATDGTFGFSVSEADEGRDLSGDGDTADAVFHVYHPTLGFSRNLGLAVPPSPAPVVDGKRYLLHALEAGMLDQNGDGDRDDLVASVYEPATDLLTVTGLASAGSAVLVGEWVGVSVSEAMQGASDLDGDGDAGGDVAHVVELATGSVLDLGLDTFALHGSATRLFLAPFEELASVDWNTDGDRLDRILFDWSVADGRTRTSGAALSLVLDVQGDHALVAARERERGGDGNGDGDEEDVLLELHDARTGRVTALGLCAGSFAELTGTLDVLALVDEASQGRDLDGDGDLLDEVLHLIRAPR